MIRRIIINLFLAFFIFPIIMLSTNYVGRYLLHDYSQFSGDFETYTKIVLKESIQFGAFVLVLILVPYNFILLFFQNRGKKRLLFIIKLCIFLAIEIIESIISGLWRYAPLSLSASLGFFGFLCLIAMIMVSLHYWLVDRRVEKTKLE